MPELPRRASPIGYYDSAPGSQDYPYPQCPGFIPIGGTLLPGRQNTGYQRRSSGKNGIVIIPGFICGAIAAVVVSLVDKEPSDEVKALFEEGKKLTD